jgi:HAD superfamily hydrolase (TIGR01549 family)
VTAGPIDSPPRAVFFDLDDTLCDYAAARKERLRIAFNLAPDGAPRARDGIDLDAMIAESIATQPHGSDHFPALFARYGMPDPEQARAAAEWYRNNRFHGLDFFPEARDVLRSVRTILADTPHASARPLGVITNGPAEVQRAKLALLGVEDLVDFAIISGEFGVAKPDPAIFRAALERADVRPQDAIFVGDSVEFDMTGARAAGIPAVWLNRDDRAWNEPNWRPDLEIRSLDEIPLIVGASRG